MCDTFVALPSHTASGNLIFAKNSDREPNEAPVNRSLSRVATA